MKTLKQRRDKRVLISFDFERVASSRSSDSMSVSEGQLSQGSMSVQDGVLF